MAETMTRLSRCSLSCGPVGLTDRTTFSLEYNKLESRQVANCCLPREPVQGFSDIIDGDKDVVYCGNTG